MSITGRRLLVYLVMLLSLLIGINLIKDIRRLNRADERLVAAETELKLAQEEQQGLKSQLEVAGSDFYLESQIRNVLKMARPEEMVAVVPEEIVRATQIRQEPTGKAEEKNNFNLWLEVFGF